jgi:hypothetical protein
MGGSGTSRILCFKSSSGDLFTVVVGMHNYNPWRGLLVDLREDDMVLKLHLEYYNGGKFLHLPEGVYSLVTIYGAKVAVIL